MFELPNIKEHENPFGISGDVLCVQRDRRTDEANLIDVLQGSNKPTAIFRPTQFIKKQTKNTNIYSAWQKHRLSTAGAGDIM